MVPLPSRLVPLRRGTLSYKKRLDYSRSSKLAAVSSERHTTLCDECHAPVTHVAQTGRAVGPRITGRAPPDGGCEGGRPVRRDGGAAVAPGSGRDRWLPTRD